MTKLKLQSILKIENVVIKCVGLFIALKKIGYKIKLYNNITSQLLNK